MKLLQRNELADELAEDAVANVGRRWVDDSGTPIPLWEADTTRRLLRHLYESESKQLIEKNSFRAEYGPRNTRQCLVPSQRLPDGLPRPVEKQLVQARVGSFPDCGYWSYAQSPHPCPLCNGETTLDRDFGAPLVHLLKCVKHVASPPPRTTPSELWFDHPQPFVHSSVNVSRRESFDAALHTLGVLRCAVEHSAAGLPESRRRAARGHSASTTAAVVTKKKNSNNNNKNQRRA